MKIKPILYVMIVLTLSGCFKAFNSTAGRISSSDKSDAAVTISALKFDEAEDKSTATVDPTSTKPVLMTASPKSSLAGTSVTISPGTLSIATVVIMESGVSLGETSVVRDTQLTSDITIQSAGPGVVIRPSEQSDLKIPLQISLPIPVSTGFRLTEKIYAVYFQYFEPTSQRVVTGILPVDKLKTIIRFDESVQRDVVQFSGYFGSYWVVELSRSIEANEIPTVKPSSQPIVNKSQNSVITSSGIVSDTVVAVAKATPALILSTPVLSLDSSKRTLTLQMDPNSALVSCIANLAESESDLNSSSFDLGAAFSLTTSIARPTAHTLIGRLRCIDNNGKVALSPWSRSLAVPPVQKRPVFLSLLKNYEALDGYISSSEANSSSPLYVLSTSGEMVATYTPALNDAGASLICDARQNYSLQMIPSLASVPADGIFAVCVKMTDNFGNSDFGKSDQVIRDTVAPSIGAFVKSNTGSDGFIGFSESSDAGVLWTLSQSGATTVAYSSPIIDAGASTLCNDMRSFNQSSPARSLDISSDGTWIICARLSDAAGNISFGKSPPVVRNISGPSFTSLALANGALDGFINNTEKNSNLAAFTLNATGYTTVNYTALLNDSASALVCDSSKAYNETSVAAISSVTTDGIYAQCLDLTDSSGNHVYGKSASFERKTNVPIFTSLALANMASDAYINDSEKSLSSPMWQLTASGQITSSFTLALDDAGASLVCDATRTYSQAVVAAPSSLSMDGIYTICVKLSDSAGNVIYGKASPVTRDTLFPMFTSYVGANEASDTYITNAEKNSSSQLYSLTASGQTLTSYTTALNDNGGALVCDASKTYTATVPLISSIASDGSYAVCVKLADNAGNTAYGKSNQVLRHTIMPTVTVNALTTASLSPAFSGSVNSPTSTVSITVFGQTYNAVNNGNGTWSLAANTVQLIGAGVHDVTATVTDVLGQSANDPSANELTITAPAFISTWKTDNAGASGSNSITLPLRYTGVYNFVVQWGDGSSDVITSYNSAQITHVYSSPGTYTVKINNLITGWAFQNNGDAQKMLNISNWGPLKFGNDGGAFAGALNLTISATDVPNMAGTTNLRDSFFLCISIAAIPNLGSWDMSAVTNMAGMFQQANLFNQNIDSWNVSAVTDFTMMFYEAYLFNSSLSSWNTSSAIYMSRMFQRSGFNQNINGWNVSNVQDMSYMFAQMDYNQPLGGWDVSKVKWFDWMFKDNSTFNQPLNTWVTTAATTMSNMFDNATAFNQPLNNWNMSNVVSMRAMFKSMNFNQDISAWNTALVTDFSEMFSNNQAFNQLIGAWNTSAARFMQGMFFYSVFNQNLNSWNVNQVERMDDMFTQNNMFNGNITGWQTSSVQTLRSMFAGASAFNQPIDSWDVSNVTDISWIFENSNFNQPLNNWNVSNVTSMEGAFLNATSFNQPLNFWDVSKVTNMRSAFQGASNFNGNITAWNLALVQDSSFMFKGAWVFNQNIGGWNVGLVTNMTAMFEAAYAFNQNLNNWNVANVTNMAWMFRNAVVFNSPINAWNVSKVTEMSYMFEDAAAFNQSLSWWDVSDVLHMTSMFKGALVFNQTLSTWIPLLVVDMTEMLSGSAMSQANYTSTLIGWAAQNLQSNVPFGIGTTQYLSGATSARATLLGEGWTISDGGLAP
ncbi:MAG: BspA family leucine-rich repeat surface protein [Proteobacteria bacterium]|nr:MAG: BspA family leucine-rich repeat surface protein [Pseudomonadota bacterium]